VVAILSAMAAERSTSDRGQVNVGAAEVYESSFVPALFREWCARVADAAGVRSGQRVLDVACGTGVLAREIARRLGGDGSVVGVDLNPAMLAVARRTSPALVWQQAPAEVLPFADAAFDAVTCQFGLMFFEDRACALREMWRVLRPEGRLAIAVWDALARSEGWLQLDRLLTRHLGESVARALHPPFALGDVAALRALVEGAGIAEATITTETGTARFASLRSFIEINVKGWTLADAIDGERLEALYGEAEDSMQDLLRPDGTVAFETRAHLLSVTRHPSG
jgi:SAM-dependent methyltransferase